ncbi:MAG: FGGY family carbohydrate kinase [Eubacteriales bacterium]|nr:FGGY family carbohydrate kinase [Eubacteriales bacterium]
MQAIGIDIGTTTISAVVLDTEKEQVLKAVTLQSESFIETENDWERIQDVSIIIKKAKGVLDELLAEYPEAASIGLTGQMHGILYTDAEGAALSPLYTWQDKRGDLPLSEGKTVVEEAAEAGAVVASGFGLTTHTYQCRNHLVPEKAAWLCTIPDYLGMVLTGRKTPLLHVSMAASLGFYDAKKKCFKTEILEKLGADSSLLPEITGDVAELGTYQGRPVTAALGDNQASFIGSVGTKENTVLLNMGTGGQISVLSDQYFEAPGIEARPLIGDKFILVGASICGGRSYAILEKFFRDYCAAAGIEAKPQYDVMAKLAAMPTAEDTMQVSTAFKGTRYNPNLRGGITNLSEDNFTPQDLVSGVLTGMARELFDMYEIIRKGTGITAEALIASGNGVRRNERLQQIFEEMFQAGLTLAKYQEEAACGAAISSQF